MSPPTFQWAATRLDSTSDQHLLALGVRDEQADGVAHSDELFPCSPCPGPSRQRASDKESRRHCPWSFCTPPAILRGEYVILLRIRQCMEGLGARRNPKAQSQFEVERGLCALGGIHLQHSCFHSGVLPQRQTPNNAKQLSFRVELLKTAAGRPPLDGRPPPLDALVCALPYGSVSTCNTCRNALSKVRVPSETGPLSTRVFRSKCGVLSCLAAVHRRIACAGARRWGRIRTAQPPCRRGQACANRSYLGCAPCLHHSRKTGAGRQQNEGLHSARAVSWAANAEAPPNRQCVLIAATGVCNSHDRSPASRPYHRTTATSTAQGRVSSPCARQTEHQHEGR